MTLKKQFDILELGKLEPSVLNNLALQYGVDTLNKGKQIIIYELLDVQAQRNKGNIKYSGKVEDRKSRQMTVKKKRVYLVAKISGLPEAEVTAKYEKARKVVESHGYKAVIPTECIPITTNWHYAMRLLIPIMLQCDAYTLIDEPHTTAGGLVEDTIANWVQLPKIMFSKL